MKRIRIIHETHYHYNQAAKFGPHRALLRPREGHDVHISRSKLKVEPAADIRWLRDIYGNSIAILSFDDPSHRLSVASEVDVELYNDNPIECLIEPTAREFPFQYLPEEQVELVVYRLPSYPYDGPQLQNWLHDLYRPGQVISTFDLLQSLNTHIHQAFKYARREEPGVQLPHETLALGSGSCRDFAVLIMEAVRHWGFGARFVTGYIRMGEGQHAALTSCPGHRACPAPPRAIACHARSARLPRRCPGGGCMDPSVDTLLAEACP